MAIFGHYLNPSALQRIKDYKYKAGEYTFLDNVFDYFWTFVAQFVPLWLAPNLLTFFGFLASWIAYVTTIMYAPNFTEATPSGACIVVAVSVFLYQTLDAVDGKHARRTGTSSPLGTLFDHGCDVVTGTILALAIISLSRSGIGLWPFLCFVVSAQLLQFVYFVRFIERLLPSFIVMAVSLQPSYYFWWEYHFHVFFSNPGYGTGVTEAQLGIILFALLSAIFGTDFWLFDVMTVLPSSLRNVVVSFTSLKKISLNSLTTIIILINNASAALYISLSGLAKLKGRQKRRAFIQISSFIGFLMCEWMFYHSTIIRLSVYPPITFICMLLAYTTILIRILLSSTSRRYYHSFQWPAAPFCVLSAILFFVPLVTPALNGLLNKYYFWLIGIDFVWQLLYVSDLLYTAIHDICRHLGICCFTIPYAKKLKDT